MKPFFVMFNDILGIAIHSDTFMDMILYCLMIVESILILLLNLTISTEMRKCQLNANEIQYAYMESYDIFTLAINFLP